MIPFLLLLLCVVGLAVALGWKIAAHQRVSWRALPWWKSDAALTMAVLLVAAIFSITGVHGVAYFDPSSYRGPQ